LTVLVARAAVHPHGLVRVSVVAHPGTKHVLHAVPVDVTTGHLTALPQAPVVVCTEVMVLVTVVAEPGAVLVEVTETVE
jgi:hypothetical protein